MSDQQSKVEEGGKVDDQIPMQEVDIEKNEPEPTPSEVAASDSDDGDVGDGKAGSLCAKLPLHPYKIALLVGSLVLCIIALIGIGTVQKPKSFFKPVQQFKGKVQFDEMADEVFVWDNAYSDMYSEKSVELIEKAQNELHKALKKEGMNPDSVTVTSLEASEPHTIVQKVPTAAKARMGRIGGTRSYYDFYSDSNWNDISDSTFEEVEHKDVNTVVLGYSVMGSPYKNAAASAASAGNWHQVEININHHLAGDGISANFTSDFGPTDDFMATVVSGIKEFPDQVQENHVEKHYEELDCNFDGKSLNKQNLDVYCPNNCPDDRKIIGGKDFYFAYPTKICVAAYYADIIGVNGGKFSTWSMGIQQVFIGEASDYFEVSTTAFEVPTYYLIAPENSNENGNHLLEVHKKNDKTGNKIVKGEEGQCQCYDPMLYMYINARQMVGEEVVPREEMFSSGMWFQEYQTAAILIARVIQTIDTKVKLGCVYKISAHNPHSDDNVGLILKYLVCGTADSKNARMINQLVASQFPAKLSDGFKSLRKSPHHISDIELIGFKYEKCFIQRLKNDLSGEEQPCENHDE